MTATPIDTGRSSTREARYFYVWMAGACVAVAFLGFAPTYWARMATSSFHATPIIHIHGLLFSSWTLFFLMQTWFVAQGKVLRHREIGLIGISLATAMCIAGVLAAIRSMAHAEEFGAGLMGREFSIVSLSAIVFFGAAVAMAIANVRDPETHKRLMLLANVSILQAAAARWFFVLFAPPDARGLSPSETGPAPVAISVPPGLLVDLLIVVAMIYDWRTRGKIHRVYLIGGPALLFLQVIRVPLSTTPAWHAIAEWVAGLAG
ncbi:MAG: hypothetical protein ABL973_13480 [Micropepsaceae bacterium]